MGNGNGKHSPPAPSSPHWVKRSAHGRKLALRPWQHCVAWTAAGHPKGRSGAEEPRSGLTRRRPRDTRSRLAPIGGRGPSNNVITAPSIIVNTLTPRSGRARRAQVPVAVLSPKRRPANAEPATPTRSRGHAHHRHLRPSRRCRAGLCGIRPGMVRQRAGVGTAGRHPGGARRLSHGLGRPGRENLPDPVRRSVGGRRGMR